MRLNAQLACLRLHTPPPLLLLQLLRAAAGLLRRPSAGRSSCGLTPSSPSQVLPPGLPLGAVHRSMDLADWPCPPGDPRLPAQDP